VLDVDGGEPAEGAANVVDDENRVDLRTARFSFTDVQASRAAPVERSNLGEQR
jgi:hypothetical protein